MFLLITAFIVWAAAIAWALRVLARVDRRWGK